VTPPLSKFFCTYVRPGLEYCSPAWSPQFIVDIDKIENVQRRFTKRIPGLSNLPYLERLRILRIESLEIRRIKADLIQTYKIVNGIELNFDEFFRPKVHGHGTRLKTMHTFQLQPLFTRSSLLQNSFSFRVVTIWNSLPKSAVETKSVFAFKSKLKQLDLSKFSQGRALRV
jgi:hypothetical protein